jgi:hypothetical protein
MTPGNRLPIRLKVLLTSVYVSCVIIPFYFFAIFYTLLVYRTAEYVPVLFTLLFIAIFFTHTLTILYFIKRVYPAGEIPKLYLVFYNISDIIVILLILLFILGTIGILISTSNLQGFARTWHSLMGKIVIIAFGILILTQLHMVIEGRGLIKMIRRNQRAELLDSL